MANKFENPNSISLRIRDWIRRIINRTINYFYPKRREEYVMSDRERSARERLDSLINMTRPIGLDHAHSGERAKNARNGLCALRRVSNFEKNNCSPNRTYSKKAVPADL